MYFHKHPYPSNFRFLTALDASRGAVGSTAVELTIEAFEGEVYRMSVASDLWGDNLSQAELALPPRRGDASSGRTSLTVDDGMGITLTGEDGRTLLSSPSRHTFGLCGEASIFLFERDAAYQFYGMGEKALGLELSNRRTKFWNTDMWGDFAPHVCTHGRPDPLYVSIPYLIIKQDNTYIGVLLNNPHATFMSTASVTSIEHLMDVPDEQEKAYFWLGCERGVPEVYVIVGPSLAELTRKYQMLVGTTPLPPAWALGYHQSRWGYQSLDDLKHIDAALREFGVPCDGIFFDIEYMDGYRVFTLNPGHFPNAAEGIAALAERGRKAVPILDPGVKYEQGYSVYEDGHTADIFCKTPAGGEFVGMVWPGETVFPDFSTTEGRAWWADQVAAFTKHGFAGAWVDMNDPSTGHVDNGHMLFDHGRRPHDAFHNQYGLGMARATREGFLAGNPTVRPFVVSRSGFVGSGRYGAIWQGDNSSNFHWLELSIPTALNLALSGVPFNGADVGGFFHDTNRRLMIAWTKAAFLLPFMRNHTVRHSMPQEPWVFDTDAVAILREYIRLRYRFRPYLYNLFIAHEQTGEAIVRPLFYDFADTPELPLGEVDDQVMVGPHVMHAPGVTPKSQRDVVLPACRWYSVMDNAWINGGRRIRVRPDEAQTPLYIRPGAILPLAAGEIGADNTFEPRTVAFHVFLERTGGSSAETVYVYDDGISFDYREGARSALAVRAEVTSSSLEITTELLEDGYGNCEASFVLYDTFDAVRLNGRPVRTRPDTLRLAGTTLDVVAVD
ncbi:MAG: glycoside hydrolase family 31 protein [Planctomycetota bacterium]